MSLTCGRLPLPMSRTPTLEPCRIQHPPLVNLCLDSMSPAGPLPPTNSSSSGGGGKGSPTRIRCRWTGCRQLCDSVTTLAIHLSEHASLCEVIACQWSGCKVRERGEAGV